MTTRINLSGLENLVKAFNGKLPRVKVGILGSHTNRPKGKVNNATVGAAHEFGTSTLPVRSFLRVPISERLEKELAANGAFTKAAFKRVVQDGSLVPFLKKVGIAAEGIVLDAFDTGGFGRWPASNMEHKKIKQTLVETYNLRDSISSEVV